MKLVTWVIAMCNRKWQTEFDTIVLESEAEPLPPVDEDTRLMMGIVKQPTHLSSRFRARPRRRKYNNKHKPSAKQAALQETMDEEFKRMAEGG